MATKGVWWKAVAWGWVVVAAVGCVGGDQPAENASPTTVISTNTASPTIRPTLTPFPTWTPLPPTLIPLPTLPPEEAEAIVLELLETNGGCEFPCWWGITPGETQFNSAFNRFGQFSARSYDTSVPNMEGDQTAVFLVMQLDDRGNEFAVSAHLFGKYGKIDQLIIEQDISLSRVLAKNGRPTSVWIHFPNYLVPDGNGGRWTFGYSLILTYTRFMVVFSGLSRIDEVNDNEVFTVCPHKQYDIRQPIIWIWTVLPEGISITNFQKLIPINWAFIHWVINPTVKPITEATGISIDDFFEAYSNAEIETCFSSPIELYPEWDSLESVR